MKPSPRLLLTIDYESWFALSRRYDHISVEARRILDNGYAISALQPIIDVLGDAQSSFYLVGEIVDWHPELPEIISNNGHEVGFHCQVHRPLVNIEHIKKDLKDSESWRKEYKVTGFRAPMINTVEGVYPLLEQNGFIYSSSLYAPTGTMIQKGKIWELPVSTKAYFGNSTTFNAPRRMDYSLLLGGEFPYGSSMMSGLFAKKVLNIIEMELKAGNSPVIFLHPYEIISPEHWPSRFTQDMTKNPLLYPFTLNKSAFLKELLKQYPVSTMQAYLNEATQ